MFFRKEEENAPHLSNDPVQSTVDTKQLLEKIKQLEEENVKLRSQNEHFKVEKAQLHSQKMELLEQLKSIPQISETDTVNVKVEKILSPLFSPGQIKVLLDRTKRPKWSKEDIAFAISLRSVSPKAYRYLRNKLNYPLPDLSTLRRWAISLNVDEGFLDDVLSVMKTATKSFASKIENIVCLSYDEMMISNKIEFDIRNEEVIGPCKSVQVMIARSIFGGWKQPIYYRFDSNMTEGIVKEAVVRLSKAGYETVAIVSDMGGANVGVWKQLGVSVKKPFFANPVTNKNIYVFADAPHMMKLLRNHYLDNGFTLGNGHVISKTCVEELVKLSSQSDLKLAYKITQTHLDVKGPQRQRVKPAVQLFSNTTAMALEFCFEQKLIHNENHKDTVDFFKLINKWFDIMNSNMKFGSHQGVNAYGMNEEEQKTTLENVNRLMSTMRVGGKLTMLPFQKGIVISNKSLHLLYEDLRSRESIEYIRTVKLNSDVLENFFAYIRGMGSTNDHPSAFDFRYRLRWYLLGKHSHAVFTEKKNTADNLNESNLSALHDGNGEDTTITQDIFNSLRLEEKADDNNNDDETDLLAIQTEGDNENDEQMISNEGLKYITGYVCHRFRMKYPHLGRTKNPEIDNVSESDCQSTWIDLLNRNNLMYPCKDFFEIAKSMERIFNQQHGVYFKTGKHILTNVYNQLKEEINYDEHLFPKDVIMCMIRTRTFIRIKEINKKLKNDVKRKEVKKIKKIVT